MISRANFFPGQPLDYRDFNRLSNQGYQHTSKILQKVFPGGGIFATSEQECFQVTPGPNPGTLLVEPGYAINALGEFIELKETKIVDLNNFIGQSMIVCIRNKEVAGDYFYDPEDPRIEGPLSKTYIPEISFYCENVPNDSVEICRIHLSSNYIRQPLAPEMWHSGLIKDDVHAIIDSRFRRYIESPEVTLSPEQFISLRQSLERIRTIHRKIQKIYRFDDVGHIYSVTTLIEADLFLRPIPLNRVAYLVSKLFNDIGIYYGILVTKMERKDACPIKTLMNSLCRHIAEFHEDTYYPNRTNLDEIPIIANKMFEIIHTVENEYANGSCIEEYLLDHRQTFIDLDKDLIIGPYIYNKVMSISAKSIPSKSGLRKAIRAQYDCGRDLERIALMCKSEDIVIDFKVIDSGKSALIMIPTYQIRNDFDVIFEVNGQIMDTISIKGGLNWQNFGIHVPSSHLSATKNTFKISIKNTESYFYVFDTFIYQPGVQT